MPSEFLTVLGTDNQAMNDAVSSPESPRQGQPMKLFKVGNPVTVRYFDEVPFDTTVLEVHQVVGMVYTVKWPAGGKAEFHEDFVFPREPKPLDPAIVKAHNDDLRKTFSVGVKLKPEPKFKVGDLIILKGKRKGMITTVKSFAESAGGPAFFTYNLALLDGNLGYFDSALEEWLTPDKGMKPLEIPVKLTGFDTAKYELRSALDLANQLNTALDRIASARSPN